MSAHAYLRLVTRASHDQVDALLGGFDLGQRAEYTRFLLTQAAAFLPIEAALDRAGAASLIPDWPDRRRSDQLRQDLAELGAPPPPAIEPPAYDSPAAIFGGAYVMEGSRLGGKMLSRAVGNGLSRHFLDGAKLRGSWASFLEMLEQNLPSLVHRELAGKSAIATFDCFFRSGTVIVSSQ